ncbi:Olfactory receptor 8G5 [Sciurus carolinensis]|uniref:Olfactory receptor 8G5 n=1 Tax=Sciurus carolinensis TaxID=30640 RepID=A0AA41SSI1_SCICA|nr:Olfactory receptor 8G5 [Sciurus carolinensis]
MATGNHSTVTEFILAGLSEQPELQLPLLLLFLEIYVLTLLGKLGMVVLIGLSSNLHTPMHYLLSSLSMIDLCHSTVITPKMLVNFVMEKNIISYPECMTQLYTFGTFNIFVPVLTTLSSYIFIIARILCIRSTESRAKAFGTCSSHISAVALFFGSLASMYLKPSLVSSMDQGKVSSVFFTIVVPMLNPLIYNLRNKDVNVALEKMLHRKMFL